MDVVIPLDQERKRSSNINVLNSENDSLLQIRQEALQTPETLNPFLDTPVEKESVLYLIFKYVIVGIFIVPFRAIICLPAIAALMLVFWVATLGLDLSDLNSPLTGWRRFCIWPSSVLSRIIFFCWGFHYIRTRGEKIRDTTIAPIVVSNHVSFLDPMFMAQQYCPTVVSEAKNMNFPFIGSLMAATKAILIDRNDPNSRQNAKQAINNRAHAAYLNNLWFPVLVYPEGACTNGTTLISFKMGAFSPGLPIQPVCIRYPHKHLDLAWTEQTDESFASRFIKMAMQFHNSVELDFLPVYTPSQEEIDDPILYASNVRNVMAKHMGVPVTEHSYEDAKLIILARDLKRIEATSSIVYSQIQKLYKMDGKDTAALLRKFAEIDVYKTGSINYSQFATVLGLPESDELLEYFELIDLNNTGLINFKEFLVGVCVVGGQDCTNNSAFASAFKIFDSESTGRIQEKQFGRIMKLFFPNMSQTQIKTIFNCIDTNHDQYISLEDFTQYSKKNPVYFSMIKKKSISYYKDNGMENFDHDDEHSLMDEVVELDL